MKKKIKRVIIKVGSSSLVNKDLSINKNQIKNIMESFKILKTKGIDVALVTSGAVATGMHELKLSEKPRSIELKQACAAVGQAKLMEEYNFCANELGLICGQILVNHDDFGIRKRMLHLSGTLDKMLENNIIPIINENDALAVEEIKVGDNDTLSALIAPMIKADLLVLFSDIDGLFDKNPKEHQDAVLIPVVDKITKDIYNMAGGSKSLVGTGGMETKLSSAKICTTCGCDMIICNSSNINNLLQIVEGAKIGTRFISSKQIKSRDHWMIYKAVPLGKIIIDDGLVKELLKKKVSILPMGIDSFVGSFTKDSVVLIEGKDGTQYAKGITNYSSDEIRIIMKHKTNEINDLLSYQGKEEVIHANNLVKIIEE